MADRFFDRVADVGSEEEDEEDFDEETGRVRSRSKANGANGGLDDSSEEEDEDDEEKIRAVSTFWHDFRQPSTLMHSIGRCRLHRR
jgi:transcription elongation factor SPT6